MWFARACLVILFVGSACGGGPKTSDATDSGSTGAGSTGSTGTTQGVDPTGPPGTQSADGGECFVSLPARLCAEDLAAWIDDGTEVQVCPGPETGTLPSECSDDPPPAIDSAAAEAICDAVCGRCPCPGTTYSSCSYEGVEEDGRHAFMCNYGVGCAGGGCDAYGVSAPPDESPR